MEKQNLNSLNIEGLGRNAGGEFDRVSISGKGTITGDLICRNLDISGMSTVEGNVTCEKIKASGMGKILKQTKADDIDVSGTMQCGEDVETKEIYVSGIFKAKQCLKVDRLETSGVISVEQDLSSEKIICDGMIKCGGFLNCESLEMEARGGSKLNEVGAANIKIKASERMGVFGVVLTDFLFLLPDFLKINKVTAKVMEGDEIDIESCEVKVVRGKNIKIGPKCKVELVEYSGTLEVDENAEVNQINQL